MPSKNGAFHYPQFSRGVPEKKDPSGTTPVPDSPLSLFSLPSLDTQEELFTPEPSFISVDSPLEKPIARVLIDSRVRPAQIFDYVVPEKWDEKARVGMRVKIHVGNSAQFGWIISRENFSHTSARLKNIEGVIGNIPLLSPELFRLCERISHNYLASLTDCVRLALPARHAREEKSFLDSRSFAHVCARYADSRLPVLTPDEIAEENPSYARDCQAMYALKAGAFHCVVAQENMWEEIIAHYISHLSATHHNGRNTSLMVICANSALVRRLQKRLQPLLGDLLACVHNESSQSERYRAFLEALSGHARILIGTRSIMWFACHRLSSIIICDEKNISLTEGRSPYISARAMAFERMRMAQESAIGEKNTSEHACEGIQVISLANYVSEEALMLSRRSGGSTLTIGQKSQLYPHVSTPEQWPRAWEQWGRIPDAAFDLLSQSLEKGSVLISVPFRGYVAGCACASCRAFAQCPICGGNIGHHHMRDHFQCLRCGWDARAFLCPQCEGQRLIPVRIGSARTSEEIGKAFPGKEIFLAQSSFAKNIDFLPQKPHRIVVASAGNEIPVEGGYAGGLIVDSRFLQGFGSTSQTAFARYAAHFASFMRPTSKHGHMMFVGGVDVDVFRFLRSWDLSALGSFLLDSRSHTIPPHVAEIRVSGLWEDIKLFLSLIRSIEQVKEASSLSSITHRREESLAHSPLAGSDAKGEVWQAGGMSLEAFLQGGSHLLDTAGIIRVIGPGPVLQSRNRHARHSESRDFSYLASTMHNEDALERRISLYFPYENEEEVLNICSKAYHIFLTRASGRRLTLERLG